MLLKHLNTVSVSFQPYTQNASKTHAKILFSLIFRMKNEKIKSLKIITNIIKKSHRKEFKNYKSHSFIPCEYVGLVKFL